MNSPSSNLASLPGHRRNGLATSVSSNCIQIQYHGNCHSSSEYRIRTRH